MDNRFLTQANVTFTVRVREDAQPGTTFSAVPHKNLIVKLLECGTVFKEWQNSSDRV
jgi:hypothetical protein